MLSLHHIFSVLSTEIAVYNSSLFLSTIIFIWLAYYITGNVKKIGFKIFWIIYGILHIYTILQSNIILYDPLFYFALSVILLQLNSQKLLQRLFLLLKQRSENKYNQCVSRNMYYDDAQAKAEQEKENTRALESKNEQQKNFLQMLTNKLDKKLKL